MPSFKDLLFGKKEKFETLSRLTPEQQQQLSQILGITTDQLPGMFEKLGEFDIGEQRAYQQGSAALEQLLGGFDPTRTQEAFEAGVARPAIKQFQEQIAPAIQERFIGAGAGRSSAGQRQLAQAGSDLEAALSGQLAQQLLGGEQLGQQAQLGALGQALGFAQAPQASDLAALAPLLNMLGLGMGSQAFETNYQPGTGGIAGPLLGAGLGMLTGGLGAGVAGGLGGYMGGTGFSPGFSSGVTQWLGKK